MEVLLQYRAEWRQVVCAQCCTGCDITLRQVIQSSTILVKLLYHYTRVIIIILIIMLTKFMVLSSWH